MIGKTYLETETPHKYLLKIFCYNDKVNRNVKDFQKLSIKEIYFTLQSNSAKYDKPSKFLHGQTSLKDFIFSVLIFSIWYKLMHFSLCVDLSIHRVGTAPNILRPRCEEQ